MGNFIDSALPGAAETAYVRLGKDLEEAQAEKDKLAKALEPILA